MNLNLKKYRWALAWCCYALLIGVFVFFVTEYNTQPWFPTILQIFGLIIPIYPTILIFIQSRAAGQKDMQLQLQHFQNLNQQEIDAMQAMFQQQIDAINTSANNQIAEFKNTTNNQIEAIHNSTKLQLDEQNKFTNQQIEALNAATQQQIENYAQQTSQVVSRLEDNSILLAEILLRQLEDKLGELKNMLSSANTDYQNLKSWQLLRLPQDREMQLTRQKNFIARIEKAISYINEKCQKIKEFLNG